MSEVSAAIQRLLPQHGLSRLIGRLASSREPWVKRALIQGFVRAYDVDLDDAVIQDPEAFGSFNEFFTRALKPGARPIDSSADSLVAPSDGVISQFGTISDGALIQAKRHSYSLDSLSGDYLSDRFEGGRFMTIYLAPGDYHRVHAPLTGELVQATAIPGALFSVNRHTASSVNNLFCRNERLVCHFETDHGRVLVVLVGALIVASIETVWPGPVSPYERIEQHQINYQFNRGDEIGRFLLGSTVIVCTEPSRLNWLDALRAGSRVEMGQRIGTLIPD